MDSLLKQNWFIPSVHYNSPGDTGEHILQGHGTGGHRGQGHGTLTAINQARMEGCILSLGRFSSYQLTYRQDGTGADETTGLMSVLDWTGRNAGQ